MLALGKLWVRSHALVLLVVGVMAAQNAAPVAPGTVPSPSPGLPNGFDEFVDSAILREWQLAKLMRNFHPIIETYIQKQKAASDGNSLPQEDAYFLSRLDLTGTNPAAKPFDGEDQPAERKHSRWNLLRRAVPEAPQPFAPAGFAQALFPDWGHFDRQNYGFQFVRWEILGDVRCAVVDVQPLEKKPNRGFLGRIWIEDQNFNIVRFTGTDTSKGLSRRTFHFDSWRLNTLGIMWMPAYVYTQESRSDDPAVHTLWFKAQTRVWGYDMQHAGDHREYAKRLTDAPAWVDPSRKEASQDLNPAYTVGKTAYTAEDEVVERLQLAGLMAPDGPVDDLLQTVVSNLLITNELEIAGIRCRVLLTTPLESFVIGRTIVVSRGLLDVLPDEATLAAVLSHELAHIVLNQSLGADHMSRLTMPFSDLEIFTHWHFAFDAQAEAAADAKGREMLAKSPYKDQLGKAGLFIQALQSESSRLPKLLRGRLSNDFESSHLVWLKVPEGAPTQAQPKSLDQVAALPLGSRIVLDPWSDRVEMLAAKPVRLESPAEKIPFEVSPFYPHLKRQDEREKAQATSKP